MWLIVYSNDHAPLTVRPIYSSSKLRTAQMMIVSLVAMIGLEKCCITSACLQWLCHSGERIVAHGPLVIREPPLTCTNQNQTWAFNGGSGAQISNFTGISVENMECLGPSHCKQFKSIDCMAQKGCCKSQYPVII